MAIRNAISIVETISTMNCSQATYVIVVSKRSTTFVREVWSWDIVVHGKTLHFDCFSSAVSKGRGRFWVRSAVGRSYRGISCKEVLCNSGVYFSHRLARP